MSGPANVYIIYSYFNVSNTKSDGGAISFSSPTSESQMLIESCTFENCHTLSLCGGAINMGSSTSAYGKCVIEKCCSIGCSSLNNVQSLGQFIYIATTLTKVRDSTIVLSIQQSAGSESTLCFYFSQTQVNALNFHHYFVHLEMLKVCLVTLSIVT